LKLNVDAKKRGAIKKLLAEATRELALAEAALRDTPRR
jgi:hypothetical protein